MFPVVSHAETQRACWAPLPSSEATPARELSLAELLRLGADALLNYERLDNETLVNAHEAQRLDEGGAIDQDRDGLVWIAIRPVREGSDLRWEAVRVRREEGTAGNCINEETWYLATVPGTPPVHVSNLEGKNFIVAKFP